MSTWRETSFKVSKTPVPLKATASNTGSPFFRSCFLMVGGSLVNMLQVSGFATQAGAVIHDFAVNLASREIDKAQDLSLPCCGCAWLPRAAHLANISTLS